MILAIVGSRDFTDQKKFDECLLEFVVKNGKPSKVISGGARGADTLAKQWAKRNGIEFDDENFKPDWKKHGKKAGILRNTDIVNACTDVIAFPSEKGAGTQDTIRKAKAQNKPVTIIWV